MPHTNRAPYYTHLNLYAIKHQAYGVLPARRGGRRRRRRRIENFRIYNCVMGPRVTLHLNLNCLCHPPLPAKLAEFASARARATVSPVCFAHVALSLRLRLRLRPTWCASPQNRYFKAVAVAHWPLATVRWNCGNVERRSLARGTDKARTNPPGPLCAPVAGPVRPSVRNLLRNGCIHHHLRAAVFGIAPETHRHRTIMALT